MYASFIDDGLCAWHCANQDLEIVIEKLNCPDPSDQVIWPVLSYSALFLDGEAEISSGSIHYEINSKPGNAYAIHH